ncbi:ArfGap-domain-containing protein [Venturia nashicola]|uniref:ArfGap-domain-containing protein n=1 Tax=Venturia nashicola TaxID=86259 RepID=A0A4Z1NQE9_9PEZI|nr:ArfGap-domain-containing protein [Venturia nashicola]TLD15022.1 ArfGap-domain-containing protein [Venturia nashicola]
MSRRGPAADPAEKNRNTLKQLVKLETNKSCSDCKRNKHPRWASWNLGVFMCIRCSGIHRGMGTHISRVKSVDLDTWTDEQLASMLRWGNARANKYWEAKLAPGHMPSEAKIENFIRTKYESKRWVMDGPMPDPSTLEVEGDDDVPLNVVQQKAVIERSASQRQAAPPPGRAGPSAITRHAPVVDLFGDEPVSAPARPSTGPPMSKPTPKAEAAPPKATKPADSLLGLDFFGSAPAAPPDRPSSTSATSSSAANSRPDLKQSILSLYASKPAAAPAPQQQSAFGGMNDAFGDLNFGAPAAQQQPAKPSPFAGLAGMSTKSTAAPPKATASAYGGGGNFFDTPASPPIATSQPPAPSRGFSSNSGFGDFFSNSSPAAKSAAAAPPQNNNGLFDLMGDSMAPAPAAAKPTPAYNNSAFNLSNPAPSKPAAPTQNSSFAANISSNDVWGSSSDAWGDSKPAAAAPAPMPAASNNGWGSSSTVAKVTSPQVTADDDFGGWSSAPHASTSTATPAKPAAFNSGNDDLFSNVWE